MSLPSPVSIRLAAERLADVAVRTPLVHSEDLSAIVGCDVYLKCENLQRTGSFKLRGAYNALCALEAEERARGVVASSAGNHGLGLALAGERLGVPVRVFVPRTAPAVKRDGIAKFGAQVDASCEDYDSAHHAAQRFAAREGLTFVNPCAGDALLAGQGTVALEVLEDLPSLRTIVVPVGGGGLVGGAAGLLRADAPQVRIVGVQGERTNALHASLAAGHVVEVPVPPTLADGLAGQVDDVGLAIAREAIDELQLVSEEEIASAIEWLDRVHGLRVEGSGAVGVALVRRELCDGDGDGDASVRLSGPVVVVLSGGNRD